MSKGKGLSGHYSSTMINDEWLTDPKIINALGPFDLDPCAPITRPWEIADKHFTIEDNGLLQQWFGFVWMNPPYGNHLSSWLNRMAMHNNGIALIFARTETAAFFNYVWNVADSMLFIRKRLYFYNVHGKRSTVNGGAPSVLIGYGKKATERLEKAGIKGKIIYPNKS